MVEPAGPTRRPGRCGVQGDSTAAPQTSHGRRRDYDLIASIQEKPGRIADGAGLPERRIPLAPEEQIRTVVLRGSLVRHDEVERVPCRREASATFPAVPSLGRDGLADASALRLPSVPADRDLRVVLECLDEGTEAIGRSLPYDDQPPLHTSRIARSRPGTRWSVPPATQGPRGPGGQGTAGSGSRTSDGVCGKLRERGITSVARVHSSFPLPAE